MARLRVVFAGGGTGGHLYPAIAVARRMQARCVDTEIHFLGIRGGLEGQLIPREGFPLHTVSVVPLKGRSRLAQLRSLAVLGMGTAQAVRILQRIRPALVIGSGGYVMGPAILAAKLLRLPCVIMEQNLLPGLAVRALARFARLVFTAFPETIKQLPPSRVAGKYLCTGVPIRPEICELDPTGLEHMEKALHVLAVGGSQGAHRINQAMIEAVPFLKAHQMHLRVVHQTGEADYRDVASAYRDAALCVEVHPFLHDMPARYHWAHLVICRAGASTLAELTACGKPAVLVPYPYAADDHQYHNAVALQQYGAGQVIPDAECNGDRLTEAIQTFLACPTRLQQQAERSRQLGKPQAADAVVTSCLQLLQVETDRENRHAQN